MVVMSLVCLIPISNNPSPCKAHGIVLKVASSALGETPKCTKPALSVLAKLRLGFWVRAQRLRHNGLAPKFKISSLFLQQKGVVQEPLP